MYPEEEIEGHMEKFILSKFSFKTELQKIFHSDHIDIFLAVSKRKERGLVTWVSRKNSIGTYLYEMHIIRIIYDKDTENVV